MSAAAEATEGDAARIRWRGSLFRKYALFFVAVVSTALLAGGGLEMWFSYREHVASLLRIQGAEAQAAAEKIGQFTAGIQDQLGWTTQLPLEAAFLDQRQFDARRLLRQVPPVMELSELDADGREQLRVSRLSMDVIGSGIDYSAEPKFRRAVDEKRYYGPVYFRDGSEPYMTVSQSGTRRSNGVSVAEVNLKFMWDSVSKIEVGVNGRAYVVDDQGRLIAHPDVSLVLRNTDFSALPQVRAALAGEPAVAGTVSRDQDGNAVLTAYARIPELGWLVYVEIPRAEALGPIYGSMARTGALLLLGLAIASFAGLFLARRMVGPIRALQAGAALFGSGDFGRRIEIRTGDELEGLADKFNEMAARLQQSLVELETRVAERTRELAEKSRHLELASQHKSQFLANMSHELRTPLNAVLGYTELILDNIYGEVPDRSREVLERVQVNGRHLLELINNVLDLSKIEAGQLELAAEPFDLGHIAIEVVASTESLARAKGLDLVVAVEPGLPNGQGDARRLMQVIFNLVGNAVKFTDRGFVEVRVTGSDRCLELAVRDSGPGIAVADHERIFGEFQQGDASSTRTKGGTGLGLAISKRIVEMHRGTIAVESSPGDGAVFRVRLPVDTSGGTVAA